MGATSTKKRSNAGKNVLVFFIVFIILEMLIIFGIGKVFKNKDVTPSIAGYSIYMTNQELTAKTEDGGYETSVPKNVLVIASNGLTNATEKIGAAVLCENVEGVGTGVFWLAAVNTVEGQDGISYTVANGDTYYTVKSSNVVGVTSSYFQTAGNVITFVTSKFGMIACAIVPLFLLVLIELIIAIATHSPEEEEDDEEEDDEPEKEVKLDDFLFGGQNEGEQIARHLAQKEEESRDHYKRMEQSFSEEESVAYSPKEYSSEKSPEIDFSYKTDKDEDKTAKAETSGDSLSLNDERDIPAYEKTAEITDEAPSKPVKRAPRPAAQRRPAQRPATQRRARPASASSTGSASLEDLMKLMEEEQNKLKNIK